MYFKIEKLATLINVLLPAALVVSVITYPEKIYLTLCFLLLCLINFYFKYIQKNHSLLRNFGMLALFRYIFESLGPELRQYLYSSDTEEKPFNRVDRSDIYKMSKNEDGASAFGSLLNFDSKEMKLKHSFFPVVNKETSFSLCFGEERGLSKTYKIDKPILVSGMSYGSLGKQAVRALSRGAYKAGIPVNTGEGGWPKYHLMEHADLIFQMGTAKFGVRTEDGRFDPDKLAQLCEKESVKMVEIKFSQGAKPGKGGLLPKEKITPEIAELRGVPMGEDILSPCRHIECEDSFSTVRFIKHVQEVSGIPVGIKFCLGRENELKDLLLTMKKENIFPDYISIDGSEGGTGAAPKTFMDDLGFPVVQALQIMESLSKSLGIRDRFKILCAGALVRPGKQMMALALGADAIYTARGFLFALGCIQALRCHTNNCPTGITTHKPHLMRGLDIELKSERVKNYALSLMKTQKEILAALGLKSFRDLKEEHLIL